MGSRISISAWEEAYGFGVDPVDALATHLRARVVLGRVLERLDAADLPALVVKGALLSHQLYASPIERPIRDVDLRILPEDLGRIARVLEGLPARVVRRSRAYRNLVLVVGGTDIDVEASIGPPFLCRLSVASMLRRSSRSIAPLGFPHWQPELHDHALVLAINAFKDHVIDASSWSLRDLELIVALPSFDIERFAAVVREARATTIVHVVARYLERRASSSCATWRAVAELVPPSRPTYAKRLLRRLSTNDRPLSLAARMNVRAGADGVLDRALAVGTAALCEVEAKIRAHRTS